jgi:hypothetical protein
MYHFSDGIKLRFRVIADTSSTLIALKSIAYYFHCICFHINTLIDYQGK